MKKTEAAVIGIALCLVFVVFALVVVPEETLTGKSLVVARASLAVFGCALGVSIFAALSGIGDRIRPRDTEEKPPLEYDEWRKF